MVASLVYIISEYSVVPTSCTTPFTMHVCQELWLRCSQNYVIISDAAMVMRMYIGNFKNCCIYTKAKNEFSHHIPNESQLSPNTTVSLPPGNTCRITACKKDKPLYTCQAMYNPDTKSLYFYSVKTLSTYMHFSAGFCLFIHVQRTLGPDSPWKL